jgi:hypothetical protein
MLLEASVAHGDEAADARSRESATARLGDVFAHDAATGNAISKLARHMRHTSTEHSDGLQERQ